MKKGTVFLTHSVFLFLCMLHLPLQAFTAGDGARYWLRIVISAYPICIRSLSGIPSEYCHYVWYEKKLEFCG